MPGKMLFVDTQLGSVINDEELKHSISMSNPTSEWLDSNLKTLDDFYNVYIKTYGSLPPLISKERPSPQMGGISVETDRRLPLFGYSVEDINMLILPMVKDG